jgi:hypothetical protein
VAQSELASTSTDLGRTWQPRVPIHHLQGDLLNPSDLLALLSRRAYKTTEFYTTIATGAVIVLNAIFKWGLDSEAIIALVSTNAAFGVNRSWQKHVTATSVPPVTIALPEAEPQVEVAPPVTG